MRAGREHHLAGAHMPEPLTRLSGVRHPMLRDPLKERDLIVIVIAKGSRARKEPDLRQGAQTLHGLLHPLGRGHAIDLFSPAQKHTASNRPLVGNDDARSVLAGLQRRHQARYARADDEHVAVRLAMVVAIRIRLERGAPHARRPPDQRFVDAPPK